MQQLSSLKMMEILARIPLFKELSPSEREYIVQMPKVFKFVPQGQVLIKEAANEPFFYIILAGKAEVFHRHHLIGCVEAGQFIGEVGFICHESRTATVTAATDLMVLKLDADKFRRLPAKIREQVKDKIIEGLVRRVERLSDKLIELEVQMPSPQVSDT